jgi:branched-chain amino acid transport system substrate-binding protein
MNKTVWIALPLFLLLLVLAAPVAVVGTPSNSTSTTLTVGAVIPLTGPSAQYGKWQMQSIDLARDEIRQNYGVTINVIYEDSQSDPKTAISAFRLIATKKPFCIITGVSGIVLALAPVAERLEIPQINTSGQNPQIANSGKYTITLINLANTETLAMASYAYNFLQLRHIAIIHSNVAAGTGAAQAFKSSFESLGGQITSQESYDDTKSDFRPQITRAFAQKPDAVFAAGVSMNVARVIKQADEMGYRTQWLSFSAFEGPEVTTVAGRAADGTIFTSTALDSERNPGFIQRYEKLYGSTPEVYAATAFDAIHVIYKAYRSGYRTPKDLASALTSGKFTYEGVTGTFTIDTRGVVSKPVLFKRYKDGSFMSAPVQINDRR